jgi:predicted AlkP superfamily pyrophosphatase or phosphodiesterase
MRKVLLVGIDGLIFHRALKSGRAKKLAELHQDSFFVDTEVDMPTISGPSWSTLLTGKRNDIHKVIDNYFVNHNLKDAPDFLSQALEKNSELITYAAAGWPPLIDLNDIGPVIATGKHLRFARDGESNGYLKVDKEVVDHALETLEKIGPDLSFVYFCGVDEAGHRHGAVDAPYFDAIERIDGYLEQLHAVLSKRHKEFNEDWLLVIVTDHGHRDEGGHGGDSPQERASFILAHSVNGNHPNWPIDMQPHHLTERLLEHL